MILIILRCFLLLAIVGFSVRLMAERPSLDLTHRLGKNIKGSFSGQKLFYHGAAFASTPFIVKLGVDAHIHDSFKHTYNETALPGAILASGVGAVGLASWFYFGDGENPRSLGAVAVIAQASLITVGYVITLKLITGRSRPTNSWALDSQSQSERSQIGFMRNGPTSYGWPSGHVSHTVAVTSALAYYYPEKVWIRWAGAGLSAYMLYTVSAYDSSQMHWFSDGVAGAFIGYAIGSTVGENLRSPDNVNMSADAPKLSWFPVVSKDMYGLTLHLEI